MLTTQPNKALQNALQIKFYLHVFSEVTVRCALSATVEITKMRLESPRAAIRCFGLLTRTK